MLSKAVFALGVLAAAASVSAQTAYGQCGGQGWTGATTCPSGYQCTYSNAYYSQCLPCNGACTSVPSSTATGTVTGTATSTSSSSSGTTTLMTGYSFIRAVEDPNFHKYLQSETLGKAGDAVLGDPGNAAQFQIVNGQLVQYVDATTNLYMTVEARANDTVNKLKTSWSTTAASGANAGTFLWSGDTLEWEISTITRPALNAWLVCPDAAGHLDLYINLGPYAYQTPAGCADETIHAYTGATATP